MGPAIISTPDGNVLSAEVEEFASEELQDARTGGISAGFKMGLFVGFFLGMVAAILLMEAL